MRILLCIFPFLIFTNCFCQNAKVSNSQLEAKSKKILEKFQKENSLTHVDYHKLIDLNYDNVKDFIIAYYGQSGTGIKNKIEVYFFDIKKNNFILNEDLSSMTNPTFYIKEKKITEFYIGNGGGSGHRLEWIKNKWTVTKKFEVDKNDIKTVWKITYPLKKKVENIVRPFTMIPPKDILETNVKE